ncbi:DUF89 domain-containing protein [Candidatus Omnitrophota bacterium]
MKTHLECISCFFKQALDSARIAKASDRQRKKIVDRLAKAVPKFSLDASPPEMGRVLYKIVKEVTGVKDPYREIKDKSNRLAVRLYPRLKKKVALSRDRLLRAVEFAIAGNIIDFGVKNTLNVNKELKRILAAEDKAIKGAAFDYFDFKRALKKAKRILYLGDNAGEILFDRVLIEEIKRLYPKKRVIYAVKEKPIINDALLTDAYSCGIDKCAEIISTGLDSPGVVLKWCYKEFLKVYRNADMVVSKGQGNFESLSKERKPIFFLFMAKCPVVARNTGQSLGDIILLYNAKKGRKRAGSKRCR